MEEDKEKKVFLTFNDTIVNPNSILVEKILKRIDKNEGYCPCNQGETPKEETKCPCNKYKTKHECCCTLYVKK